jgi:crotonobetainyl-CoA:carnitine CoA-transferase CaiB-like acyl-CoA transferase
MSRRLPLTGVRVTDLTVVLAGPNAATLLADWGAEVIRVEPLQVFQPTTRGRTARPSPALIEANRSWINAYPGWRPGKHPWNLWPLHQAHARNKLSMTMDLRRPEGKEVLLKLVRISDLMIENNVPETLEKLGLDYEVLRRVKPDLIMVRMPAYGLTGPYRNYRSMGSHLDGAAGHTQLRGYPDTDPTTTEDVYFGDACAAVHGALAAALALRQIRRTGRGQLIELAQTESLLPFFGEFLMDYQMNGRIAGPVGNDHYLLAPNGAYPCAGEDRWVAISVGRDIEWAGLVRAMGEPTWARDPRFASQAGRHADRRELDRLVSEWTAAHEDRWLMATLQREGVPAGVLNDEADAYADPQLNARGFFETLTHPDAGTHRYPGIVWRMARTPNRIRTPPATLGEHNPRIYRELLGFSAAEYDRFEREGHIGTEYPPHIR